MSEKKPKFEEALARLNAPDRLDQLRALVKSEPRPTTGQDVNNHIHTTYSFSPYSPTAAVWANTTTTPSARSPTPSRTASSARRPTCASPGTANSS